MFIVSRVVFALFLALVLTSTAMAEVIVDTDMGLDDGRAVFALIAAGIDIETFITVGGSAAPGKGADNLIGLLEAAGCTDAQVIIGEFNPESSPPPWRSKASLLAGNPFPPPRVISADYGGIRELEHAASSGHRPADYLAMGPLTNLMHLIEDDTDIKSHIEKVWIPVDSAVDGKIDPGWNMNYDLEAAQAVLKSGIEIVLVDVSSVEDGLENPFSGFERTSPASEWISAIAESAGRHIGLFDEVAAAACLEPSLFVMEDKRYSAGSDGGEIALRRNEDGNVRIAHARDEDEVLNMLKTLWEKGGCSMRGGEDHHPQAAQPLELMKSFHGHLGPWVVLGYRAGRKGLEILQSEGHFGLSASVSAPGRPPASCFIDGVQLGSGCTLGKRNIKAAVSDGPPVAEFILENGRRARISVLPPVADMIGDLVDLHGVEEAGRIVWEKDLSGMIRVEVIEEGNRD